MQGFSTNASGNPEDMQDVGDTSLVDDNDPADL